MNTYQALMLMHNHGGCFRHRKHHLMCLWFFMKFLFMPVCFVYVYNDRTTVLIFLFSLSALSLVALLFDSQRCQLDLNARKQNPKIDARTSVYHKQILNDWLGIWNQATIAHWSFIWTTGNFHSTDAQFCYDVIMLWNSPWQRWFLLRQRPHIVHFREEKEKMKESFRHQFLYYAFLEMCCTNTFCWRLFVIELKWL